MERRVERERRAGRYPHARQQRSNPTGVEVGGLFVIALAAGWTTGLIIAAGAVLAALSVG